MSAAIHSEIEVDNVSQILRDDLSTFRKNIHQNFSNELNSWPRWFEFCWRILLFLRKTWENSLVEDSDFYF